LEAAAPGDLGTGTYTLSASDITLAEPPRPYSSTDGYGEISVVRALDQLTGQRLTRQPALGGVFWGLDRVGAPTAWAAGITGAGITVAVIDTGVDYLHPDIDANIWTNTREIAGNGIDDDNNGFIDDIRGWDFAYNDNDPSDVNGHGTHVAGTIAAENNGFGQIGVAYNARIMPVKVLSDTGSGSFSNVARGIRYAADNGADVINLSLGGTSGSFELLEAIRYASSRGSLLLMSAGNSSMTTPGFPAAYASETGLAIGAVDISGTFASFSNQAGSAEIDYVTAPGVNVYSLSPNNAYRSLNGTSMAAPHVAGVAALLLSYRPELTPVQLESLLISTTKPSADALATPSAPQAPAGGITAAFAEEASLIELPWIDDDDSDFGGDHADSESDGDDNNRDLEIDVATDAIKGLLPDELTITSTVAASPASSIASDLQDAGINDSQSAEIVQMVFSNAIGDFGPMAGKAPSVDDLADPSTLLRRLRHLFPDEDPLEVVRRVWSRTHPQRWPSP
jgi:subtilisin family serine protease